MNLVATLLKEHSKTQCNKIVKYVGTDARRFSNLVAVFLSGPYRVTQRAAWPLSCCVERHPELIKPHLKRIIKNLIRPGLHDSVKRNTVRLMQFIDIPRSLQGAAASICFEMFQNPKEPIAVRVFSMSVLSRIAKVEPALEKELKILIEDQLPYASAGFLARAKKVLKQLG